MPDVTDDDELTLRHEDMLRIIRNGGENGEIKDIVPNVFALGNERSLMGVVYACYYELLVLANNESDPQKKKRLYTITTAFHRVFDAVGIVPDDPPETLEVYELLSLLDRACEVARRADLKRDGGVRLADAVRGLRDGISFDFFGEPDEEEE